MAARRVEKSGFGKERDGFFWKRKKGKLRRNFHGYFPKWTDRFRQSWIDCDLLSCSTGKKRNLDILSGYVSGQRACDRSQGLQRYDYERRGTFWKRRNDLVLIRYCALRWSPTSGEWLQGMVRNRVGWRQSRKAQWERQRQEQPNSADLSMPGGSRIFCSREQDSEGHLDRRSDHREVFRVT